MLNKCHSLGPFFLHSVFEYVCVYVCVLHTYMVVHACLCEGWRSMPTVFASHFLFDYLKAESLTEPGAHGFIVLSG